MTNEKYNGWRNYETWLTALWLDNEQASQEFWREETRTICDAAGESSQVRQGIWTTEQARRFQLAVRLKNAIEEDCPIDGATLYADLISAAIAEIDFQEIAEHYLDEIEHADNEKITEAEFSPFGNVIASYSRAEALRDGVLRDVSKMALEAGIKYATALTATAWARCVAVPPDVTWNDEAGRLWDVVSMLRHAMQLNLDADRVGFQVSVQTSALQRETIDLYAVCHPDDDGFTPVITVMLYGED